MVEKPTQPIAKENITITAEYLKSKLLANKSK
jgi:hypothetical protein